MTAAKADKPLPTLPSSSSGRITPPDASLPSSSAANVPLSQLAQFANIPPTSPISPGHSREASAGKSEPHRSVVGNANGKAAGSMSALTSARSAPTRQKTVDAEQHQASVRAGAEASRGVVDSVIRTILSPNTKSSSASAPVQTTASAPADRSEAKTSVRAFPPDHVKQEEHVQLNEEELDMTIEQYLKALYEAKHRAMKADGERMIREWSEHAESQRRRVVAKHFGQPN